MELQRIKKSYWLFRAAVHAGKVYFIAGHYDVKLQADNHVRWDVAERLNRKQIKP